MKIMLDARYVRERPSGIGAMVDAHLQRVPFLMPDVDFVFLRHPKARTPLVEAPNCTDMTFSWEANGPVTLFGMRPAVGSSGVDLFHGPQNLLPMGLSVPAITTVHDLMWLNQPEHCRSPGLWGGIEQLFYQTGIRHGLRKSRHLIAISHATKDAILKYSKRLGAAPPPVSVVSHGVDDAFHPAKLSQERQRELLNTYAPGADAIVLTIGQASGYKNHEGVVAAFAKAAGGLPGVHLVLVQRLGPLADRLRTQARQSGVGERVHFAATVPFRDLVDLYCTARCLLHPSFWEGWGMPITEAFGCGCPVITSNASVMPEVANGAAQLVEPRDVTAIARALEEVVSSEQLRIRLKEKGLARAQELNWDTSAQALAGVYRSVLAGLSKQ